MHSPNRHTDELIAQVRRLLGVVEWLDQTASDHGHADDCCFRAARRPQRRQARPAAASPRVHPLLGRPTDGVVSVPR